MIKCSDICSPCCQHCIHAEYEDLEISGEHFTGEHFTGEAEKCKLHPDDSISGDHWCDDFHCFRAEKQNRQLI